MSLLKLHLLGSPVLRQRSAEVTAVDDDVRRLVEDMLETMDAAGGVGLAANQIGVARRVAVIDAGDGRFALINPVILSAEGQVTGEEGCLSIPDLFGEVARAERIVVEALDERGASVRREADGLTARAIQHEIDHLDGILFLDHLSPLRRQMLLTRWRKDHKDDRSYIKDVTPDSSQSA